MNKPNFFLVGAPKCGTTALSEYLRAHPQVFMATPKEPHYFATDFPGLRYVRQLDEYERLYAHASPSCRAIGEASPGYLFSREAISGIYAYNPDARLIVTLRNPVDLIVSYHSQLLYSLFEDAQVLERAWRLQEERLQGRHLPLHCRDQAVLQYRDALALGTQLQRLLSIFPRNQVLMIFYDDFRASPANVYRTVQSFLGIDYDGRNSFPIVNPQKASRWSWLNVLLHDPPDWTLGLMRRMAGTSLHAGIVGLHSRLKSLNTKPMSKNPLSPAFRTELSTAFLPEIVLLENLTGRDLVAWKRS